MTMSLSDLRSRVRAAVKARQSFPQNEYKIQVDFRSKRSSKTQWYDIEEHLQKDIFKTLAHGNKEFHYTVQYNEKGLSKEARYQLNFVSGIQQNLETKGCRNTQVVKTTADAAAEAASASANQPSNATAALPVTTTVNCVHCGQPSVLVMTVTPPPPPQTPSRKRVRCTVKSPAFPSNKQCRFTLNC